MSLRSEKKTLHHKLLQKSHASKARWIFSRVVCQNWFMKYIIGIAVSFISITKDKIKK